MACLHTIFELTDNLVVVDRLHKTIGGVDTYLNSASVELDQLKDQSGLMIQGFATVVLSNVPGSNGRYEGMLPASVSTTAEAKYLARITAVGDGIKKTWFPELVAKRDRR